MSEGNDDEERAAAQELFKYSRAEGGFTGWLANRLPQFSQAGAYEAIRFFQTVGKFTELHNLSKRAVLEVAKAEPDIQKRNRFRIRAPGRQMPHLRGFYQSLIEIVRMRTFWRTEPWFRFMRVCRS